MRRRGTDQTTAVLENPQDPELGALRLPSRFKPIRVIGRGGMAQVVRCHDSSLNREVAVKLLFRIALDRP